MILTLFEVLTNSSRVDFFKIKEYFSRWSKFSQEKSYLFCLPKGGTTVSKNLYSFEGDFYYE